MHSEATKSTYAAPNRKLWVYGLLVATVLGALAYFGERPLGQPRLLPGSVRSI